MQQRLAQHCKSTILQFKKKESGKKKRKEIHPESTHVSPTPPDTPVQAAVPSHLADCSVLPPLHLCSLSHTVITLQLEHYFWNVTLLPRRLYQLPIAPRGIFTTISQALHGPLAPRPRLPPLRPGSIHSGRTGLLTAPRAHQACSGLGALAPTVPSAPGSLLRFLRASRSPLTALFKIAPYPTPCHSVAYPALFSLWHFHHMARYVLPYCQSPPSTRRALWRQGLCFVHCCIRSA